jgi:hypothetical protein
LYWSASNSRHFLRFYPIFFKKQARNHCFTPLLLCMTHNDLPTKWIFIKESARWSGIHYSDPYDRCGLTWIILCPLSALSLDEGLSVLNGKMRQLLAGSAEQPNVSCNIQDVTNISVTSFTSLCKYWQNKHGEWLCTCLCIFRKQIHLYSHNYDLNCHRFTNL